MDRSKLIQRLMATFLGELGEHVRAINDDLLALEKAADGPDRLERVQSLFRSAHSLKGAARSVGAGVVEHACHHLEGILVRVRDGGASIDGPLFALLFATADAIEEAGMRLREQQDLTDSPLAGIVSRLESAASGVVPAPAPPPQAPAPRAPAPALSAASDDPPPEPAAVLPTPPPPQPGVASRPAAAAPRDGEKASGGAFVRIPAGKLDAMLSRSGELLIARRRVESRTDDLLALRDGVGRWLDEWRGAIGPLRKLEGSERGGHGSSPVSERSIATLLRVGDHLGQLARDLDACTARMAGDRRQLARAAELLDEQVRQVRMLPFSEACQGLERIVRDVASELGKSVELVIEGGGVELDRSVLEWLKDPLVHLVRNAVDHGIESPEARRSAGKPPTARVTVAAALRGTQVEVVVGDDGRGIDRDALRRTARQRGIPEPSAECDLDDLIFQPGFSTAPILTSISGRGVGLDVVRSRLESLHGTIELESRPGHGTRFSLAVPLTLATLRALLVEAGGQIFALAGGNVRRLVRIGANDVRSVEGRPVLAIGGPPVPLVSLADALGIPGRQAPPPEGKRQALVVASGDRRLAVVVDELLDEQEIIVKSLGARIRRVGTVSGASILPSGRIALVLNVGYLVRAGLAQGGGTSPVLAPPAAAVPARRRLLVVDDSVTTRTLEKSILEAAGYDVATAVDGEAGWRLLQEQGADLVITDVEMPRMDGFALTEAIRASARFASLPVVLFTSRASDRDQARGIEVGADAYIVKGAFDQKDLLETLAQLL